MTIPDIEKKAIRAITAINAAVRSIHFQVDTPSASLSIDEAYQSILDTFEHTGELVFSESENRLQVGEKLLAGADIPEEDINAFVDLLIHIGICRITFGKELTRSEFGEFLKIISTGFKAIQKAGGLHKAISDRQMPGIFIEQRVEEFANKDKAPDADRLDPEKDFNRILNTLNSFLPPETREEVFFHLADALVRKDDLCIVTLLMQGVEPGFLPCLASRMDTQQFERIFYLLRSMYQEKGTPDIRNTLEQIIATPPGVLLRQRLKSERMRKEAKQNRKMVLLTADIGQKIGDASYFTDARAPRLVARSIRWLLKQDQMETAERFSDYLADELFSDNPDIRLSTATALVRTFDKSSPDHRNHLLSRLTYNLSEWIRIEKTFYPEYERIGQYLAEQARTLIREGGADRANHILAAFHESAWNESEKKESQTRKFCARMLCYIASDDILEQLVDKCRSDVPEEREQAIYSLIRLGEPAVIPLLGLLKQSVAWYERARILKIITDIGLPVLPVLEREIRKNMPWYYLRNIILLFGRMGDASHTDILQPFLDHEDDRVQREALTSIHEIGGDRREEVFLDAFSKSEEPFRRHVVRMLGQIKSRKAVPRLLYVLRKRIAAPLQDRDALAEELCIALGHIGGDEAIPVLREILHRPDREDGLDISLKNAAEKGLALIMENQIPGF